MLSARAGVGLRGPPPAQWGRRRGSPEAAGVYREGRRQWITSLPCPTAPSTVAGTATPPSPQTPPGLLLVDLRSNPAAAPPGRAAPAVAALQTSPRASVLVVRPQPAPGRVQPIDAGPPPGQVSPTGAGPLPGGTPRAAPSTERTSGPDPVISRGSGVARMQLGRRHQSPRRHRGRRNVRRGLLGRGPPGRGPLPARVRPHPPPRRGGGPGTTVPLPEGAAPDGLSGRRTAPPRTALPRVGACHRGDGLSGRRTAPPRTALRRTALPRVGACHRGAGGDRLPVAERPASLGRRSTSRSPHAPKCGRRRGGTKLRTGTLSRGGRGWTNGPGRMPSVSPRAPVPREGIASWHFPKRWRPNCERWPARRGQCGCAGG